MKQVACLTLLLFLTTGLNAQVSVYVKGQVINTNNQELLFIENDECLIPINLGSDGTFTSELKCRQLPSFVTISSVSKRRKIKQHLPRIWFTSDSVKITLDIENYSFQTPNRTNFQDLSEKIEALGKKERLTFLVENYNHIPALYFIEREKRNIALDDLKKIYQEVQSQYGDFVYVRRLGSFIDVKNRSKINIGSKLEDFHLPDKNGDYQSVLANTPKQKLVVILSSGCLYSIASISLLEQFYKINKEHGEHVELITIWEDKSKDIWLDHQSDSKNKIVWANLWDEYGFASMYFNLKIWPTFYVISDDGILIEKFIGYNKKAVKRLERLIRASLPTNRA